MWIELTDEYASKIKDFAKRKIRLQDGSARWAYWHKRESCFFWNSGEEAVYMDDPSQRPTHIMSGLTKRAADGLKRPAKKTISKSKKAAAKVAGSPSRR